MPKLLEVPAATKTRPVGLDKNETHSSRATFWGGPNHDDDEIAHLPVVDERLLAGYHIVVALAHRTGTNALQITSGAGFGHRDRANGFTRHHSRQPFLLLFCGPVAEQVTAAHVVMHREVSGRTSEPRITKFLDDARVVPKVAPSTAELFRDLRAKQAGRAAGIQKRPIDDACVLPPLEVGRDLQRRKTPHGLPELVVFFVVNLAIG